MICAVVDDQLPAVVLLQQGVGHLGESVGTAAEAGSNAAAGRMSADILLHVLVPRSLRPFAARCTRDGQPMTRLPLPAVRGATVTVIRHLALAAPGRDLASPAGRRPGVRLTVRARSGGSNDWPRSLPRKADAEAVGALRIQSK
jgi:hypothetical protein